MDRFCQPHSPYPILAARPAGGRFRPKSRPNPAFAGYNSEKAQYSDTPVLQHSARQDSTTRTTTKRLTCSLAMLLFLFSFLISASLEATAGDQPSGDPNRVVWRNPAPQLSQNALRGLVAANLSGLETGGYMLVIVRLDAGKATEVRALMSSGSLIADKEICQFVLDHWVFNPKATGIYKLSVLLRAGL